MQLRLERGNDVFISDEVNVAGVISCGFICLWTCHKVNPCSSDVKDKVCDRSVGRVLSLSFILQYNHSTPWFFCLLFSRAIRRQRCKKFHQQRKSLQLTCSLKLRSYVDRLPAKLSKEVNAVHWRKL